MSAEDRATGPGPPASRRSARRRWPIPTRRRPRWPRFAWPGPSCRPTWRSTRPSCSSSTRRARPCARRCRAPAGARGRGIASRSRWRASRPIASPSSRRSNSWPVPMRSDRIAELRVQWDGLPPMPSEYAASLTRRFQDASRTFEDRERRRVLAEAAAGRLETLATELEQLLASDQPVEEVVARWRGLRRDADVLREHAPANPGAAERLERAVASLEEKEQQHQQARVKVRAGQSAPAPAVVPPGRNAGCGRAAHAEGRRSRAARDPVGARRACAAAVQEGSSGDPGASRSGARRAGAARAGAARRRRVAALGQPSGAGRSCQGDGGAQGRREPRGRRPPDARAAGALEAGGAGAARAGRGMWRRFKTAQDEVFARTAAHFAAQNEERAGNLARKQTLCERAEALADSTDWVKTATEIQPLQAEWKTHRSGRTRPRKGDLGALSRRMRSVLHPAPGRSEAAQGRVGRQSRPEGSALRHRRGAGRLDRVGQRAATRFKQLQAEWKTIGPVRKSRSEAIWQRFRAACDRFFDRYKHRDQVELQEKAAVRDDGDPRARGAGAGGRCAGEPGAGESLHHRSSGDEPGGSRRRNCRARFSRIWLRGTTRLLDDSSRRGPVRLPAPISIPR